MTSSASGQQDPYGSSGYGYSGQQTYGGTGGLGQNSDTYSGSTSYGYQRSNAYDAQDSSLNDSYSQSYYARNGVSNGQQPATTQTGGLSNLVYATSLDGTSDRQNATPIYQNTNGSQINRMRSPLDTSTRYSVNPPSGATSYPMQQQVSTSSNSSQQLAANAAAALAGAVGRQYNRNQHGQTTSPSPNMATSRPSVAQTQRTASPQTHNANANDNAYTHTRNASTTSSVPPSAYGPTHDAYGNAIQQQSVPKRGGASTKDARVTAKSSTTQGNSRQQQTSTPRRNIQQTGSIANLVTSAQENDSNSYAPANNAQSSAPTFIDPTAVFDPYHRERERKRQEAAIEAQRKAEEAEAAERQRIQEEADAQKQAANAKSTPSSAKKSKKKAASRKTKATTSPAVPEEEVMAAELKAMMEKMKAFQSKDPSLFKKLWNDMRQPGSIGVAAAAASASVQSPSPQIATQPLPKPPTSTSTVVQQTPSRTAPLVEDATESRPSTNRKKNARRGPDGEKLRLNGYPVVIENNPEGLPDLGRFPAERRIRANKYNKRDKSMDGTAAEQLNDAVVESGGQQSATTTPKPSNAKRGKAQATPAALQGALGSNSTPGSATGTIWPLEKRNALTATALKVLKANPENAGIELTDDDLRKILGNNPSYITLCETLEQRGLKFHRGHFARELLNSVPELKTPTPAPVSGSVGAQQEPSTSGSATSMPPPATQNVQAQFVPVPPPGYMVQWHGAPTGQFVPSPVNAQYGQGALHPNAQGHPPPTSKPPKPKHPARPEPPPGSKEAAARKRDFSELVDLTGLSDDENYVMPEKHPRLEGPDSDVEMEDNPFQGWQKPSQPQPLCTESQSSHFPKPEQPMQFNPLQQAPSMQKKAETTQRMILAKSLNKSEALKKQYYDPKTVARDILIASGRHPYERPLNVHLAGMLSKYIELESDVSTFEWDEIDPGGPRMPQVELVDIPATKPRFKLGDRIRSRKSRLPSEVDKTRPPVEEKRDHIGTPSPLSQPAPMSSANGVTPRDPGRPANPSGLRHSLIASDEHATPATLDPTLAPPPQLKADTAGDTPVVKRRMGRPPGSKNKYPSMKAMREQAAAAATNSPLKINVPSREPTPTRDKFKCKWRKCQTVLHNLDTLRKHIGRVHRPSADDVAAEGYTCWWKRCKYLKQEEGSTEWITTKAFDHWEDWLKHIERDHITPIAMKFGDGPSIDHVGKHT